jgi:glycogen debranching enzyme
VQAPSTLLSGRDGQVRRGGVQGWFRNDVRQVSELVVTLMGPADAQGPEEPEVIGASLESACSARFVGVSRLRGDPIKAPTLRVERRRDLGADRLVERISLVHAGRQDQRVLMQVRVAADHTPLPWIRSGGGALPEVVVSADDDRVEWSSTVGSTALRCTPDPDEVSQDGTGAVVLRWQIDLTAGTSWHLELVATSHDREEPDLCHVPVPLAVEVTSGRSELERLVVRSVADLAGLTAAFRDRPRDVFATAGSPWYLTLFGRDALWAARLALPLGTSLAGGTLRALARRQGTDHNELTGEQPGKILHEIRVGPGSTGHQLPPVYYGSVDATPLWISLLHDAWRWGLPEAEIRPLLPNLDRALDWVLLHADADGDALVEYVDESGIGLVNQGWKDSSDAVPHADGILADAPLALCEAQAYVVRACLDAAALIEGVDPRDATRERCAQLRQHARDVAEAFRSRFWVDDARGRFPAVALDRAKRPVASATSNLGHLLATGLLDADEEASVVDRLRQPDLDCGRGLRTLSAEHPRFNPLGYHTGSVWPHDTAIAVLGCARSGYEDLAASLAMGLVDTADQFQARLPELFAGTGRADPVLAYPASCRPQAWSAASAVAMLQAALGLESDVPNGTFVVAPRAAFAAWFPLHVRGLRVAGRDVEVRVDRDGDPVVQGADGLQVSIRNAG